MLLLEASCYWLSAWEVNVFKFRTVQGLFLKCSLNVK